MSLEKISAYIESTESVLQDILQELRWSREDLLQPKEVSSSILTFRIWKNVLIVNTIGFWLRPFLIMKDVVNYVPRELIQKNSYSFVTFPLTRSGGTSKSKICL